MFKTLAFLTAALLASGAVADAHLPKVDAEVRRVDTRTNKISLRHGEIPNLDMPPMTMVFEVQDPALLENVRVGDKALVTIDQIDSVYTVLSLEAVR